MERLKATFDTSDIIEAILKCHELYKSDSEGIAQKLKGNTVFGTCQNIHDYILKNVTYKLDESGIQFAKRPNRTLTERLGDCKSMSLLTASILHNLGIPFSFRFASYDGAEYTHVYIIVHDKNQTIVIDPVWTLNGGVFNTEKEFIGKPKDYKMKAGLYIGTTNKIGALTGSEMFEKYYPPVVDMLFRLNDRVNTFVLPTFKPNALAFLEVVANEAKTNHSKLLIFNGYANQYLTGKSDWAKTIKALAVVMSWKSPLSIGNVFEDAWQSTKDFVQNVGDNVGDKFRQFTDWAGNVIRDAAEAAASAAERVANKAQIITVQFVSWSSNAISKTKDWINNAADKVANVAKGAFRLAKKALFVPVRNAFLLLLKVNFAGLAHNMHAKQSAGMFKIWTDTLGGEKSALVSALDSGKDVKVTQELANTAISLLRGVGIGFTGAEIGAAVAAGAGAIALFNNFITPIKELGEKGKELFNAVKSKASDLQNELKNLLGLSDSIDNDYAAAGDTEAQEVITLRKNSSALQAGLGIGAGVLVLAIAGGAFKSKKRK